MASFALLRMPPATLTLLVLTALSFAIPPSVSAQQHSSIEGRLQVKKKSGPEELHLSGRFHLVQGTNKGVLILRAQIPEGNYIASLSQPDNPTKIKVTPGTDFKTHGKFQADRTSQVVKRDPVMKTRLEKHRNTVQFFVDFEIAQGADPHQIEPVITFSGQVCSDKGFCTLVRGKKIAAMFAGYYQPQTAQRDSKSSIRR